MHFKVDDVRIREIKELAPPSHLLREFPCSEKIEELTSNKSSSASSPAATRARASRACSARGQRGCTRPSHCAIAPRDSGLAPFRPHWHSTSLALHSAGRRRNIL